MWTPHTRRITALIKFLAKLHIFICMGIIIDRLEPFKLVERQNPGSCGSDTGTLVFSVGSLIPRQGECFNCRLSISRVVLCLS